MSVTTQHNDNLRTGQNLSETILTPQNVNSTTFGKLFSLLVDGSVYAQPLYLPNVTIPASGVHNVLYVATEHDSVYAFDADSNTGTSSAPLWQASLIDTNHGAGSGATPVPSSMVVSRDITPEVGITGTPVIDASTGTLYVVAKSLESGAVVQRLHALDITSGAERPGSPVAIQASIPGTGSGSVNGTLNFNTLWELQRPGLLLLNGSVLIGFAAHGDNGPWHGWILSYDSTTLQQTDAFCATRNGFGSGFWMSGAGLAADQSDPNVPEGRVFVTSGNGSFNATYPLNNNMSYGDDTIRFSKSNGALTVTDMFTPHNQADLSAADLDFGSGGILLLPDQAGSHPHLAIQVDKAGVIYVMDRDNLGGYNAQSDNVVQAIAGQTAGLWASPAYFNNTVYMAGKDDHLKAFSVSGEGLSATPVAVSNEVFGYPGSTPAVSANGTGSGIVWTIHVGAYNSNGAAVLQASDAANVANLLYKSDQNTTRDTAGPAVKFTVPTIANGKVYLGAVKEVDVYGLLTTLQTTSPVFAPTDSSFTGSTVVTITDATPGAQIFYTTDGSVPTTASTPYTAPITLTATTTLNAIAAVNGLSTSLPSTATYANTAQAATPVLSLPSGSYTTAQTVAISDTSAGAQIFYTVDGTVPTTASILYSQPVTVAANTTLRAIAIATGLNTSAVAAGNYVIAANGGLAIDFSQGFSTSLPAMVFNGSTGLDDTRLQLTNGGLFQAGSAFFGTPVNVQAFTTDFSFQLSNAVADGVTFTIQNVGPNALGKSGGGLGYGPDPVFPDESVGIGKSVAVKLDLYENTPGEGQYSTGLYLNGAIPSLPSIDLSPTGINLHSGDQMSAHLTYDGATLGMTITDSVVGASYSTSWPVDIPGTVGASSAYVGFTGGTGLLTSSQKVLNWTYTTSGALGVQQTATPVFTPTPGTYAVAQAVTLGDTTPGASIYYTVDGSVPTKASTLYTGPISIGATTTIKAIAVASGYSDSAAATGLYTIATAGSIDFSQGFSTSQASMTFNGSTKLNDTRLQLTSGVAPQAASAFFNTPVNVQKFTSDFTFQLLNTQADGFTFTIQGNGPTALGPYGGGLGYGPDQPNGTAVGIAKSVAIKFDVFSNAGEGINSTGLYSNGASPTVPASDLTASGVNLQSGNAMAVHLVYDGATLTMTITDSVTKSVYTQSWTVDIPGTIGGPSAYLGFTAGAGNEPSDQEIETWTFAPTP